MYEIRFDIEAVLKFVSAFLLDDELQTTRQLFTKYYQGFCENSSLSWRNNFMDAPRYPYDVDKVTELIS